MQALFRELRFEVVLIVCMYVCICTYSYTCTKVCFSVTYSKPSLAAESPKQVTSTFPLNSLLGGNNSFNLKLVNSAQERIQQVTALPNLTRDGNNENLTLKVGVKYQYIMLKANVAIISE